MLCTAWLGCVTLAQTLQVFSKGSAEGITLSSRSHTVLCLFAGSLLQCFHPVRFLILVADPLCG